MSSMKLFLFMFACMIPFASVYAQNAGSCKSQLRKTAFLWPSNPKAIVTEILNRAGIEINGSKDGDIEVLDERFYRLVLTDPDLMLGETYMSGMWRPVGGNLNHISDLVKKLYLAQRQNGLVKTFAPLLGNPLLALKAGWTQLKRYSGNRFTNKQLKDTSSLEVIEGHYDLPFGLFNAMLDPTFAYTSGLYLRGDYTLSEAQIAKYHAVAKKLGLEKGKTDGQTILDIGCGFGGLARFLSENYNVKVMGITLSKVQLRAAKKLSEGNPNVQYFYLDYRNSKDFFNSIGNVKFDHIVSIEMVEAVGHKNFKTYFQSAYDVLKDGGGFLIQHLTNIDDAYGTNAWFDKYIFTNGSAPSLAQLDKAAHATFGKVVDRQEYTDYYAQTLLDWNSNFQKNWDQIKLKYKLNDEFKKMWEFYLLSVRGAFQSHSLMLHQSLYVKKGGHPKFSVGEVGAPTVKQLSTYSYPKENDSPVQIQEIIEKEDYLALQLTKQKAEAPKAKAIPLDKNAKILVIGGGVTGLSIAEELNRNGYNQVTLTERENTVGGKSHSVLIDDVAQDHGATMLERFKYGSILKLANKYGIRMINFPKENRYSLETGTTTKQSLFKEMKVAVQALMYLVYYVKNVGIADNQALKNPTDQFAVNWQVLLNSQNLGDFERASRSYVAGFGYDNGEGSVPAKYAMTMFSPSAILGAMFPRLIPEAGTQIIWKKLAEDLKERGGVDIRTNTEVERIVRNNEGVFVYTRDRSEPEFFNKVIFATPPASALKILGNAATPEEVKLYGAVKTVRYSTFAVRVDGLAEGQTEVGYLEENMVPEKDGHPMAWIKRDPRSNVFVIHINAPDVLSDEVIMKNIEDDLNKIGGHNVKLVSSMRWDFFPHVTTSSMIEDAWFQRFQSNQGKNHSYIASGVTAMETMADSYENGKDVAQFVIKGSGL